MAKLLALAVLATVSGCLILPASKTEVRVVGERHEVVTGPVGDLELHAQVAANQLRVTAIKQRVCSNDVVQTVEVRRYKSSDVELPSDGPHAADELLAMIAVIGVPLTVVSGIVTEVIVVASSDTKTREQRRVHGYGYACPVAAVVPIELTLVSGTVLYGVTDSRGVFTTPFDGDRVKALRATRPPEPPQPAPPVTDSASEDRLHQQQRAFSAVRDTLRSCGATHQVTGVVNAQLAIDHGGNVTATPDIGDAAFAACVRDGIANITFPPGAASKVVFPYRL